MSEPQDSFIFYRSFFDSVQPLKPRDQLAAMNAICAYALYGTEPELSGMALSIFTLAKPNLDANRKRRKNGASGGRPKKKTNGFEEQKPSIATTGEESTQKEKPMVSISDDEKAAKKKPNANANADANADKKRHAMHAEKSESTLPACPPDVFPTVDEVAAYARERGVDIDPQDWLSYHAERGWQINGEPIRDWKAAFRASEGWARWKRKSTDRPEFKNIPGVKYL